MATKNLQPVYPADSIGLFVGTAPTPDARRINAWHLGLSLIEQAQLPVVRERNLLQIATHLREHPVLAKRVIPGWYGACLPAPDTRDLSTTAQEAVVAPFGETACPVAIGSWIWLNHFLATGESLGKGLWMRCLEPASLGNRIGLGVDADGLRVGDCWGNGADGYCRLASLGTSSGEGNLVS